MKNDGQVILGAILGKKAEEFYVDQLYDFLFYVRSLAFIDIQTEEDKIKEKIQGISSVMLQKTVKYFLIEKYGTTADGTIRVSVADKELRDMQGNVVHEIVEFKKRLTEIAQQLLDLGMEEFEKGRNIAIEITQRVRNLTNMEKKSIVERDFSLTPPLEAIEVEMLRLERKLPFLSHEEGKRLADLYGQWHHVEEDKEIYAEKN